jgi:hypothetical protein
MAIRGRKPKATFLRLVQGNPGKRPLPPPDPAGKGGSVERPARLRGAAAKLWDAYIAKAFWLTWADSPKAAMWCHLTAEFEKSPAKMLSSRIAQLRALGSELGFDVSSRTRMGVSLGKKRERDPYLDDDDFGGDDDATDRFFK